MLGPIGITEMVIIVVIALLVFGPKNFRLWENPWQRVLFPSRRALAGVTNQSGAVEKSKEGCDKS